MTSDEVRKIIVMEKVSCVKKMIKEIKKLSIFSYEGFISDKRNIFSEEPCLRRTIEGLFDLLRQILLRAFASGIIDLKKIAKKIVEYGIISKAKSKLLFKITGYRNRIFNFYQEICSKEIEDIEEIININFKFYGEKI